MPYTILVVEDNDLNMELVRDILEYQGFQVRCAGDAQECLAELKMKLPDLILMDVQLPDSDGYTLVKEIKTNQGYKQVPIIALTAYAMKGDLEKALNAGCVGVITKPIHIDEFLNKIREFLK